MFIDKETQRLKKIKKIKTSLKYPEYSSVIKREGFLFTFSQVCLLVYMCGCVAKPF